MVDLPTVPRRIVTTEAPNSSLTRADIASPYGAMAQAMSEVSTALMDVAEQHAEDAGAAAVVTNPDGSVTVERTAIPMLGRAGQKYERAIRVGAVASADASADRALIDLREQARGDPQAFLTSAQTYRDRQIEQFTPIVGEAGAAALRRQIDNRITQTYSGLQSEHQRKELQRFNNSVVARQTTLANEMENLAASGGIGSTDYEERLGNYRTLLDERVNAPNSTFTREQADLELSQLQSRLQIASIHGRVERALESAGPEEAMRIAEAVRTDQSLPLTLQQRQTTHARAVAAINGRVRADAAEATAINQQITAIDRLVADGTMPTPERLASLRESVRQANNPALTAQHAAMEASLPILAAWRQMPPAQLENELGQLERQNRQGGDERTAALLRTGRALLTNMRTEIGRDPIGWADRSGTVTVPPIDFASPDATDMMRHRAAIGDIIARQYGIAPVYLRPEERRAIEVVASSGSAPMQAVAQLLVQGFGARSPQVMREISQQSPLLAHLGGLLSGGLFGSGSQTFANDVSEGAGLMRNEESRKALPRWAQGGTPSANVARFEASRRTDQLGSAFIMIPDTGRAAEASAKVAFAVRAMRHGFDPSTSSPTQDTQRAFNRALQEGAGATFNTDGVQYGGVVRYGGGIFGGGNHVLVPGTVRADRFRDVIRAIGDQDLSLLPVSPIAANGSPYTARDIQRATPVAVPGGYRFAMGDPASENPQWIRGADGGPFVLDFDAIAPVLRQRVPGAFAGGR